ncbi:MAG: SLC13 family permease, partial [Halobacteria archaeon]|nr:SLC13 family permease [Halobacteria archaeon]
MVAKMALSTGALIVFTLIFVALVLFVTELLPPDVTAIGVLVAVAALQPYTDVEAPQAISGFASQATVTIIAMYILSEGIEETGVVERIGYHIGRITGGEENKLLGATVGTTGVAAGIVNNTPVVAVFIPMITGLAEKSRISPSKLLIPLSYAAMLGGTLTLIGTATNILASDLSRDLLDHPISMFEFTPLGVVILIFGSIYLLTVGRRLIPERIEPAEDSVSKFGIEETIVRVSVRDDSPLLGKRIDDIIEGMKEANLDVLHIERDGETYTVSSDRIFKPG